MSEYLQLLINHLTQYLIKKYPKNIFNSIYIGNIEINNIIYIT